MKRARMLVLVATLGSEIALGAGEVNLDLKVQGSIDQAPEFQNATGTKITEASFDFSGNVAGTANRDIDSKSVSFKMVRMREGNSTLAVATPSGCKIGTTDISASHVKLVMGGTVQGSTLELPNDVLKDFAIRFLKDGNYGDKDGTVACTNNGSLTYSY